MNQAFFRGTATAIVTPFSHNKIDIDAYDALVQTQLDAGVAALVVTGTTGEASTLTRSEKTALWQHSAGLLCGRIPLIVGVGTNDTATSVELAKLAQDCGANALLAVTPYYNKCTQDGLIRHYEGLADATPLPLIAYNVPSRTGLELLPETFAKIATHPNICGIKDAQGSIAQTAKLLALCGETSGVWCGNDDQVVASMALGAEGVISVLSNVRPHAVVKMTAHCLRGDFASAREIQLRFLPLIRSLFSEVNPIPVKAALAAIGLCRDELRLPLTPMSAAARTRLLDALEACPDEVPS